MQKRMFSNLTILACWVLDIEVAGTRYESAGAEIQRILNKRAAADLFRTVAEPLQPCLSRLAQILWTLGLWTPHQWGNFFFPGIVFGHWECKRIS